MVAMLRRIKVERMAFLFFTLAYQIGATANPKVRDIFATQDNVIVLMNTSEFDNAVFGPPFPTHDVMVMLYRPGLVSCQGVVEDYYTLAHQLQQEDDPTLMAVVNLDVEDNNDNIGERFLGLGADPEVLPRIVYFSPEIMEPLVHEGSMSVKTLRSILNTKGHIIEDEADGSDLHDEEHAIEPLFKHTGDVILLTDVNFQDVVFDETRFVLVAFYTDACEGCKELADSLNALARKYKRSSTVTIAACNLGEEEALGNEYDVLEYPTVVWYNREDDASMETESQRTYHGTLPKYQGALSVQALEAFIEARGAMPLDDGGEISGPAMFRDPSATGITLATDDNFQDAIGKDRMALVFFYRRDNEECRELEPVLHTLGLHYQGQPEVNIVAVDAQANQALARMHMAADDYPMLFLSPIGVDHLEPYGIDEHVSHQSVEVLRNSIERHIELAKASDEFSDAEPSVGDNTDPDQDDLYSGEAEADAGIPSEDGLVDSTRLGKFGGHRVFMDDL